MLADSRFNRQDKRSKFPQWIKDFMRETSLNLSTESAIDQIKTFQRQMGQPIDQVELRKTLWDANQIPITYPLYQQNHMIEGFIPDSSTMLQVPVVEEQLLTRRRINEEIVAVEMSPPEESAFLMDE